MDMYEDLTRQTTALHRWGVKRVTKAAVTEGHTVPVEACYLYVIHPDDEYDVRTMCNKLGGSVFLPCQQYRHMPLLIGEIGSACSARVLVDPNHVGPPRLYGAGERVAVVASVDPQQRVCYACGSRIDGFR